MKMPPEPPPLPNQMSADFLAKMHAANFSSENHGDVVDHVDERWLVSYADMMTLLFGFFVLMYSAVTSKGGYENLQQQMSQQFSAPAKPTTPAVDTTAEIKNLETSLAQTKLELAQTKERELAANQAIAALKAEASKTEASKEEKVDVSSQIEAIKRALSESDKDGYRAHSEAAMGLIFALTLAHQQTAVQSWYQQDLYFKGFSFFESEAHDGAQKVWYKLNGVTKSVPNKSITLKIEGNRTCKAGHPCAGEFITSIE